MFFVVPREIFRVLKHDPPVFFLKNREEHGNFLKVDGEMVGTFFYFGVLCFFFAVVVCFFFTWTFLFEVPCCFWVVLGWCKACLGLCYLHILSN